jgi:hypothetical protein
MLTFSGGDLSAVFTQAVTVGSASVLLDLEYYAALSTTPPGNGGGANGDGNGISEAGGGGSGGGGGGGGCLIRAAAEELDGILAVMAILAAVGPLAGPALRRARVKPASCRRSRHHPYSGHQVGCARS